MFKKDHFLLGVIIGLIMPVLIAALVFLINYLLVSAAITQVYLDRKAHYMMGIAGNLLPIRYYFVNVQFDRTGRGVVLVTFVLILLFFSVLNKIL
jgi:hypothetical protein